MLRTGIRVPLTVGSPPQTRGSRTIRACDAGSVLRAIARPSFVQLYLEVEPSSSRGLAVEQDAAADLAALQGLVRLVDLVQGDVAADHLAQLELAIHEQVDEQRQVDALADAAERG